MAFNITVYQVQNHKIQGRNTVKANMQNVLFGVCGLSASNLLLPLPVTRRHNFSLVQIETNCRRHSKVHLK